MKPMKIVLLTVAAVLAGACSLQESPEFFVNRSNFYRNKSECIAGLNSCYIPLKTIYNFNFGVSPTCCTTIRRRSTIRASKSRPRCPATEPRCGPNATRP